MSLRTDTVPDHCVRSFRQSQLFMIIGSPSDLGGGTEKSMKTLSRRSRLKITGLAVLAAAVPASLMALQTQSGAAPVTINESCTAGTLTPFGNTAVSGPATTQVGGSPLALSIPGDITATATVLPGGTVHITGTMNIDIQAKANDILINQVKPGIKASQPGLEGTAYLNLSLIHI